MAHLKKQLLEYLIRECVCEVISQIGTDVNEDTVVAPAPPADGLGTADQPPIPYDNKKIDELKEVIKNLIREAFSK